MTHRYHNRPQGKTIIRDSDTVVKSTGTVILGSGAIVRSSGTIVRFDGDEELDKATVQNISRVTLVGVVVNVVLAVLKLIGGYFGKSQALVADAVHTISDLATDAVVLIGVRFWSEPADEAHPHGHAKIETLVTLVIGIMLAIVGLGLGYDAVRTLTNALADGYTATADTDVSHSALWLGFGAAVLSIVAKEILYRWTAQWGARLRSSALVANAWHHRSDALSSIPPALAIGSREIGLAFGYDLWFLDPIGAIIVCVMLLHAAWEVAAPSLHSLLDAGADRRTCKQIERVILATPDVLGARKIRSRYIGPDAIAVDMHLLVAGNLTVSEGHAIASRVRARLLASDLPAVDVVIHVEPAEEIDEDEA